MKRRVLIFDTTLRDGEQSPGFSMNINQKMEIAKQLELLGVDVIEAGFPIASKGDFEAVKNIAGKVKGVTVAGLCRANKKDIMRAWEALENAEKPRLHIFIATSDIHIRYKLKMSKEQVLQAIKESITFGKNFTDNIEFSAEDASRSDRNFLAEAVKIAADSGATVINLPDTVGYAMPEEYGHMFREIKELINNNDVIFSAHTHNDLGLAAANALAAIENGAEQVECTINGIGERAGNASLEEVVMAICTRKQFFNRDTGIRTEMLYPTSQLVSRITNVPVPPNKAIVGDNAFAHEAGIHQDGVLKNPLTYEIMTPQSVGVDNRRLVIGKHSGRHALHAQCKKFGVDLTMDELNDLYNIVINIADENGEVSERDLKNIVEKFYSYAFVQIRKETEGSHF